MIEAKSQHIYSFFTCNEPNFGFSVIHLQLNIGYKNGMLYDEKENS